MISVNGLWKEISTRNWWTQSSDQKNAGEWEKGEEEACWGRCHQEDQQNGRENIWAVQKPSYTKTGTGYIYGGYYAYEVMLSSVKKIILKLGIKFKLMYF